MLKIAPATIAVAMTCVAAGTTLAQEAGKSDQGGMSPATAQPLQATGAAPPAPAPATSPAAASPTAAASPMSSETAPTSETVPTAAASGPIGRPDAATGSQLPPVVVEQRRPKADAPVVAPAKRTSPPSAIADDTLVNPKRMTAARQPVASPQAAKPAAAATDATQPTPSAEPLQGAPSEQAFDTQPGTSQGGAGLGGRFTGYTVSGSAVSTKDAVAIMQNPVSVKAVPRQVLDDQQAITVQDAIVGNVSNVQPSSDTFYDGFTIRGFDRASIYRNNLRTIDSSQLETANLQSIEVLKGPAAMFFGRLEPGGAVNLVSKRPLETPYYSVEEQIDNWGRSRTTVDASGPLTADKVWLYRINGAYTNGGNFRDYVWGEGSFVAPAITFRPSREFELNIDGEYQENRFVADADTAIPAIGTRPATIPISRYLQEPAVTAVRPTTQTRGLAAFDWTYRFAPDWSVTNRFSYQSADYSQRITNLLDLDETTGIANRGLWDYRINRNAVATNVDINGKFSTGSFTHAVLVGTDYQRFQESGHGYANYAPEPLVGPINIFQPTYAFTGYAKPADNDFYKYVETWTGVYAQDKISFLDDRVHLLFGGRYDWSESRYGWSPNSLDEAGGPYDPDLGSGTIYSSDHAFSPRAGIVIQPIRAISLYASYSKSFGLTNALVAPGSAAFPPEIGTQWEGGVKVELFDKRLTVTAAYFDLVKTNIVQSIPGTQFSRPVGEVESKGFEVEVAGRIDQNWSILANYGYDDARITKDMTGEEGNILQNTPRHAGSVWVKYDADGVLKGFSIGGGVTAVGERQGDNQNDFQLPSYARVDAMVMYRLSPSILPNWKNAAIQLNVRNVLDETYYLHSYDRFSIAPGAPRTFLLSLRSEF